MSNLGKKQKGQIFTPDYIVDIMLDYIDYKSDILQKHIIDNSCGDGAFLIKIVDRYCREYIKYHTNNTILKHELETYIHGIEMDILAYNKCLEKLNNLVSEYGLTNVKWDVINGDTLLIKKYHNMMDFVVGNPPYVRVHNLDINYDNVKQFNFASSGMIDLYLVFYEIGFNMLNHDGKLSYITPSSWMNSLAGRNFRNYIQESKKLVGVIDLAHNQIFNNATTYVIITYFDKTYNGDTFDYYGFGENNKIFIDRLSISDCIIDDIFYLGSKIDLDIIRNIKNNNTKSVKVKNGYATLADSIFINELPFYELTIPIIKASTGKWYRCFYPYDDIGKPLDKDFIFSFDKIKDYLNFNKNTLLKGKTEKENKNWYLYGRTQALNDTNIDKISINTLIKDLNSIKLNIVPKNSGVYSGLYIITNQDFNVISNIIKSENFIKYIKILKKYKSGGYYTFNSKDIEDYLNFNLK
ncbi:MAG: N-6 DNA methylase [Candidatus Muirbacterium halophilum]|nr:N-6 DNA methylase [Candidatus Muirbacterium halophilum]